MTEENKKEEKIAKIQDEENISKNEAEKKFAQRTVQEITGESAETTSKKVQDTLQIFDALLHGNLAEIIKEKRDIHPDEIKKLYEHMLKNPAILDELARIGYGADQLNVHAGMLKDRFDEVIKDINKNGDAQQQEKTEEEKQKETAKENGTTQDSLKESSDNGAQMLADAAAKGIDTGYMPTTPNPSISPENVVATVGGKIAEESVKTTMGNGPTGKIGGKIAKKVVEAAIKGQLGGLGQ